MIEWHYKRVPTGEMGRSDDRLADAAGLRVDAERVVDVPLIGFGLRGRAHVQRASVRTSKGGGDALLAFEDAAQRGPTGVLAVRAQPGADDLRELVGDDGDEQVAVGPPRLAVVDGALRWSRWFGPLKGFVKVYSGSEITPSSSVSSLVIDDDEALWSCGNLAVPTQAWAATIAREISNGRWAPASPTSGVGATLSGRPRDGQIHSVRWDMLSGPALS